MRHRQCKRLAVQSGSVSDVLLIIRVGKTRGSSWLHKDEAQWLKIVIDYLDIKQRTVILHQEKRQNGKNTVYLWKNTLWTQSCTQSRGDQVLEICEGCQVSDECVIARRLWVKLCSMVSTELCRCIWKASGTCQQQHSASHPKIGMRLLKYLAKSKHCITNLFFLHLVCTRLNRS